MTGGPQIDAGRADGQHPPSRGVQSALLVQPRAGVKDLDTRNSGSLSKAADFTCRRGCVRVSARGEHDTEAGVVGPAEVETG